MIKNISKILFVVLLIAGNLLAQKFELTADRTKVGVNDRFQVYFTFEKQSNQNVSNFKPPSFNGFRVLSGPNQSTSMQIINGQVSSSITFSYILTPQNVGNHRIGKAAIEFNGKTYESNTLDIQVVQGSVTPQQKNQDSQISEEELRKNVFIRATVDKSKVYRGEQVTVTYKLYTKLNISSPQISKLPKYNGFWQEEIPTGNTINWDIEMHNGERFRSAVIKKAALFPTKTGELEITPFELEVPVLVRKRRPANDFFDEFFNDSFFGRTETIQFTARSNSIKIEAMPLPLSGQPESFNGAVGQFDLKSDISNTNVKTNESISLKFTLSGRGNIQLVDLPELELPTGFEIYEPKSNLNINRSGTISGTKTFEYLIVPRIAGVKKIEPLEFSYFNPAQGRYVTLHSPEFTLNIERGAGSDDASTAGFSKEDIKLLNEDIRYIKTSNYDLRPAGESRLIGVWFWLGLIIPAFVLTAVVGIKKRQDKLSGNVQLMKYRKAEKAARNRLKRAKKLMTGEESLTFYTEISKAMNGYLEDKLNIQKSEFTLDKAVDKLKQKSVDDELIKKMKEIYERCEYARFAPSSQNLTAEQSMYDDTINVIVKLEAQLNAKKKR